MIDHDPVVYVPLSLEFFFTFAVLLPSVPNKRIQGRVIIVELCAFSRIDVKSSIDLII